MKKNSNKANSKKIQLNMNLKVAQKLKITKSQEKSFEWEDSLLYRIYVKSFLLNKQFQIANSFEISVFNINRIYLLSDAENKDGTKISEGEEFMIYEETEIEILKMQILNENVNLENNFLESTDILIEEFEKKLQLNKKEENIFKKILETKYATKTYFSNVELIGYAGELQKLEKIIKISLENELGEILYQNTENNINVDFSSYTYKGIIISGTNGIGKTNLIRYIQKVKSDTINFFNIDLIEDLVLSKSDSSGESFEEKLKNTFKWAKMVSPSIIILEEIDKFFYKEEGDENQSSSSMNTSIILNDLKTKILFTLIKDIDNLKNYDKVLIISSCINADKIYSDLRKSGRFDYILNLSSPDYIQRKKLFQHMSKNIKNELTVEDYEILADKSHGFVSGDIMQVFKEALITPGISSLNRKHLENALKNIKPINLKDVILDIPKVLWDDIGGNKEIIKKIRQSIEWPLKNPEAFKKIGISPPNGILLYGPPGCSKTMIAKALATESGLNFFAVKGPELFSKYVGDTEKAIRDIFKKAKISSPSIIFFDEIDAMASQRGSDSHVSDKVLCQLLNEMDGIESREKVVIFGATNRPDILDKAMIRPGRFDRLIFIAPPDKDGRKEIFRINLIKMSVAKDVEIDYLADITEV